MHHKDKFDGPYPWKTSMRVLAAIGMKKNGSKSQPRTMTMTTKKKKERKKNKKQKDQTNKTKVPSPTNPNNDNHATAKSPPKTFVKMKSFDQRYEDLKLFQSQYGHCNVPHTYPPNQPLSNWCYNVRYSYGMVRKGLTPTIKITQERMDRLKKLGFEFETASMVKRMKKQTQEHEQQK
jgi:hypothetical protein